MSLLPKNNLSRTVTVPVSSQATASHMTLDGWKAPGAVPVRTVTVQLTGIRTAPPTIKSAPITAPIAPQKPAPVSATLTHTEATTPPALTWFKRVDHLVNASAHHTAAALWSTAGELLKGIHPQLKDGALLKRADHLQTAQQHIAGAQAHGAITDTSQIESLSDVGNYAVSLVTQSAVPLAATVVAARTWGLPGAALAVQTFNTAFNVNYQLDTTGQANLHQAAAAALPATAVQLSVGAAFPKVGMVGWAPLGATGGLATVASHHLSTLGAPVISGTQASFVHGAFDGALMGLVMGPFSRVPRRVDDFIDLPRSAWSRVDEPGTPQIGGPGGALMAPRAPGNRSAVTPTQHPVVLRPSVVVMNPSRNVFFPQSIRMPEDPEFGSLHQLGANNPQQNADSQLRGKSVGANAIQNVEPATHAMTAHRIEHHFGDMALVRQYDSAHPRVIDVSLVGDPSARVIATVERDGVVNVQRFDVGDLSTTQAAVLLARALRVAHTGWLGSLPTLRLTMHAVDPITHEVLSPATVKAHGLEQNAGDTPLGQVMSSALKLLGINELWLDYAHAGTPLQLAISAETAPVAGPLAPPGGKHSVHDFGVTPNGAMQGASTAIVDARNPQAMVNAYKVGPDLIVTALRSHPKLADGTWLAAALDHSGVALQPGERVVFTNVGDAKPATAQRLTALLESAGYVVAHAEVETLASGQVNAALVIANRRGDVPHDISVAHDLALTAWRRGAEPATVFDAQFSLTRTLGAVVGSAQTVLSGDALLPAYSPLTFYGVPSDIKVSRQDSGKGWQLVGDGMSATVTAQGLLQVQWAHGWATRAQQGKLRLQLEVMTELLHSQGAAVHAVQVAGPHAQVLQLDSFDTGLRSCVDFSEHGHTSAYEFNRVLNDGQLVQTPDGRYLVYFDHIGLQRPGGTFHFVQKNGVTTVSREAPRADHLEHWRDAGDSPDYVGTVSFDGHGNLLPSERQWLASRDEGFIEVGQGPATHPQAHLPGLYHLAAGFFPHGTEAPGSAVSTEALLHGDRLIVPGYTGVRVERLLADHELPLLSGRLGNVEVLAKNSNDQIYYFSGNRNAVLGELLGERIFSDHHMHPGDPAQGVPGTPKGSGADQRNVSSDYVHTLAYFPQAKLEPSYVLTHNDKVVRTDYFGPLRDVSAPPEVLNLQGLARFNLPELRVQYRSMNGLGIARISGLAKTDISPAQARALNDALIEIARSKGDDLLSNEYELDRAPAQTQTAVLQGTAINRQVGYDFTTGNYDGGHVHVWNQNVLVPAQPVATAQIWARMADSTVSGPVRGDGASTANRPVSIRPSVAQTNPSRKGKPTLKAVPAQSSAPGLESYLLNMPPQMYASIVRGLQQNAAPAQGSAPNPRLKPVDPPRVAKALLEAPEGVLRELKAQLEFRETHPGFKRYPAVDDTQYARLKALVNNNRGTMGQLVTWVHSVLKAGEAPSQSIQTLLHNRGTWARERAHVRQVQDNTQVIAQIKGPRFEVLDLLTQGRTVEEIAQQMQIKSSAAEAHLYKIYEALGVFSRPDLLVRYPDGLTGLAQKVADVKQARLTGPSILPAALDLLPRSHLPVLADLVAGKGRDTIAAERKLDSGTLVTYISTIYTTLGIRHIPGVDLLEVLLARYDGDLAHDLEKKMAPPPPQRSRNESGQFE